MRTIHKYVLPDAINSVPTFEGARFLYVGNQSERITVWAEVNTLARECVRIVHVRGTGHEVPVEADYVGSALFDGGNFVFHVYAGSEEE